MIIKASAGLVRMDLPSLLQMRTGKKKREQLLLSLSCPKLYVQGRNVCRDVEVLLQGNENLIRTEKLEHFDYFKLNQGSLYCKECFSSYIRLFCFSREHSSLLSRPLGPWWLIIPSSTGDVAALQDELSLFPGEWHSPW